MHYALQYLKHLLTATNQHGVHSPFVFDYLTKCLYAKPVYKGSKSTNVVLKSIAYFSISRFTILAKDCHFEKRIQKEFGLSVSPEIPIDFMYLDQPDADILDSYKDKIHNDSLVLIDKIHGSSQASSIWKKLSEDEIITVSVDLFHCGILFFRKEQEKEHFKIRI